MKDKFYALTILIVITTFFIGCSKEPPKCSDNSTIGLVKSIISGQIDRTGLSEKEIHENMKIEYPRASALDEKIKKYTCEARLIAGDDKLPIIYESQLDDNNKHIVSVLVISKGGFSEVESGIKKAVETKTKTEGLKAEIEYYNKTLAEHPEYVSLYLYRAEAYHKLGNEQKATEDYNTAARLSDDNRNRLKNY